ncbi:transglycosylase domain-containing protein [Fictibacillus aquaticus]|uniref:Monofunctional biosynthetic peptidoglycan transglycosylase n=1 Tax=Fictibacillus aquaticus TaxID=2021314 RepID=A0A235F7V0_9BACL|nr:PBP1A family penicillin-binding protein [Fictibacillus aquaticus]OYD57386.1 monofunctional biosynthetic peptidoglycan transglycosylase [Fictibacillus aquaticus]
MEVLKKYLLKIKEMPKQEKQRLLKKWSLLSAGAVLASFAGLLLLAKLMGPPALLVPQTTVLHARDGSVIGEIHNQGQNRYWMPLKKIDQDVIDATLSIEDKSFFKHSGFDFKRIAGALLADIKAGSKVQGASTVTQQYARNLFLTHDKTWRRKLQEAFYTLRLEMNYSKEEILEGYLNTIYYGHGTYGIQSAAHYYYGKNADDLTLAEASMLAGIPKGPSAYSPVLHYHRAKDRQAVILTAMAEDGHVTENEKAEAKRTHLSFQRIKEEQKQKVAPYFQDAVLSVLKNELKVNPETLRFGGLHIYTTLDANMQKIAEDSMNGKIKGKENLQAAFVAMDPRNGDVRAMIGGRDYSKSPFNRAVQAKRAPGSTFKPFLYYAALENGYTPSTSLKSEPTAFAMGDGHKDYEPQNFKDRYANDFITMSQAIAMSDNIYAVKTNLFLGPDKLVKSAKKFGIHSPLDKIPSLALGSKGVGVMEMTNAYNLFANGGHRMDPVFIQKITDRDGRVLYEHEYEKKQVLNEENAYVLTDMLAGMFDDRLGTYTAVTGSSINQQLTRPMAGKSGSTPNDSWMIGFTPQLTASVWVGYDKGEELGKTDTGYSKRIWAQFMEEALQGQPAMSFKKPDGVTAVTVNPANGKLATDSCPVTRISYYKAGTEPTEFCDEHGEDHYAEPQQEEESGWFNWW